jgi:thiopurine S-methyltransferase
MDPDFWHARWQQGQIGFHLGEPNPNLVRHHAGLAGCKRVLVPLCGKSLDLAWLARQGHQVLGVELSPLAVQAFFAEQRVTPVVDQVGPFTRSRAGGIEILCGDLFALEPAHAGALDGLYDRAALVALPDTLRARYAERIATVLPRGAQGLLIGFEFEPKSFAGPPFGVYEAEVRALYEASFEVSLLERRDITAEEVRFQERGATGVFECAYRLARR